MTASEILRGFREAMRINEFHRAAREWLAADQIGLWPQSAKLIRRPAAYAAIDNAFPGRGGWRFEEISLLADGDRVVTDRRITHADLEVIARAITFHETRQGRIARQTEYGPDRYPVPAWRVGIPEVDGVRAPF
ncbi:hypothetical protein [Paracoccus sediminicola]|uniref:hypothetical protein n=1 Tax=Paracoccus sediminicola TaxID=3017783 RepID=UPI0022F0F22D|nr:hypothetical protein [Paracoccus sediminicola]WBU57310.1 hypothetical protein PAF18_02345 [Paracoccus sediminicola]